MDMSQEKRDRLHQSVVGNGQSKSTFEETLDKLQREPPLATSNGHHDPGADPDDPGLFDESPEPVSWRILGSDFWNRPKPEKKEYIVDQIIRPGRLTIFHGPPSGGKSFLIQDLMLASALEQEWMGKKTKPAHWFYLDKEMDEEEMLSRFRRLALGRGFNEATQMPLLDRLSFTDYSVVPEINLAHHDDDATHELLLQCAGVDVVVIDSWAKVLGYEADANNESDCLGAIRMLNRIRDATSAAIVLIAHNGKGKANWGLERIRGSSAIGGEVEIALQCYKKQGGKHVCMHTKHRPFSDTEAWDCENTFTIQDDEAGNIVIAHEVDEGVAAPVEPIDRDAEMRNAVYCFVRDDTMERCATPYIKKGVKGRDSMIVKALQELVAAGELKLEKDGQSNYYSVPGF